MGNAPYIVGHPTKIKGYEELWPVVGINNYKVFCLSEEEAHNTAQALCEQHWRGADGEDILGEISRLKKELNALGKRYHLLFLRNMELILELEQSTGKVWKVGV